MVATNSGIGNEGTTAPLISSAAVTGSSGTDFFKKVYGNVAWNKLKVLLITWDLKVTTHIQLLFKKGIMSS